LLDSHVALWWLGDDLQLGVGARLHIDQADQVFVSVITIWELGIKRAAGKIDLPDNLALPLSAAGFELMPIAAVHAGLAPMLPMHHGDPFDRMIIAQAKSEQLTVVTADRQFHKYDVPLIEART
jgi:PIN domain nuclease of toxin-antitoxin system